MLRLADIYSFFMLHIQVEFVGECGADFGGMARELWTLLGEELYTKKLGAGGVFAHDAIALKTCVHAHYDYFIVSVFHLY